MTSDTNMTKQILNVGQCGPDHIHITQLLKDNFDVQVQLAETHDEAVLKLRNGEFDLVLLNRIYDATGTQGLDTLRVIKSDDATCGIPVMLVSNYEEAQVSAVAEGALPGFGKSALADPVTVERLATVLGES